MSYPLQPHGLQHARFPCPSLSPGACSNSCPLSHDAIQPSHPLSPPFPASPQSSPASVFSNGLTLCIRWPKYWSFSFSISPSNEYSGLISFRMDWFDLLAAQGTLKSLLQRHSSKASILQCSAFFTVQLSHPCRTTGKTIALTRRTFVSKVQTNVSLSRVPLFATPWTVAYQAPLSMEFSRQESWSGLPFPTVISKCSV